MRSTSSARPCPARASRSCERVSGRIGVLISGRGSNLQALIDAQHAGRLGGEIALVVANVATAQGLQRAAAAAIPACFRSHQGLAREAYDAGLLALLREHAVDLVCLAGYMRLLSPPFVRAFPGRILNVHPSLLPAFPGLAAPRQALDYGARITGATVHFVDEGLDTGPIVLQEAVAIDEGDTEASLAARILAVEHRLYPAAVRRVLGGGLRRDGRRVLLKEDE
jgi:phosphoribosylglycinamide formyltransferase 1